MKPEFDFRARIVSLRQLEYLCEKASHAKTQLYEVCEVSSRFVSIDCWSHRTRTTVMCPIVPVCSDKGVMLHIHRVTTNDPSIIHANIAFRPLFENMG